MFILSDRLLPDDVFQYIAGFTDGDGCFSIGGTGKHPPAITISNTCMDVLIAIHKYLQLGRTKGEHWGIGRKREIEQFLSSVGPFLVIKKAQAELMSEYISGAYDVKPIKEAERVQYARQMSSLNSSKSGYVPSSLDWPYLAGLIDSDGSIRGDRTTVTLTISQRIPQFLAALVDQFGGRVSSCGQHWQLSGKATSDILAPVEPFLLIKKRRAQLGLEFISTIGNGQKLPDDTWTERSRILGELGTLSESGPNRNPCT